MENQIENDLLTSEKLSFDRFCDEVLRDYQLACESREASLMGRKEVLTGKAKFGIFGDGKEVAQIAAAKFFRPGDFRAGYYRDQTFVFASKLATIEQFFAQLYANPDVKQDPFSAGRQMNSHFATPNVDAEGNWLPLAHQKNISSDMAPTAGQMPRALGLAYASKVFRKVEQLSDFPELSNNGNEVCFCTIGDASTSEGHFWETVNAAGVMQVPLAIFVWDDGYGISVPKKLQTTKGSISEVLKGFQQREGTNGIDIYKLKGWDYASMVEVMEPAIRKIRDTHIPAVFHIEEITQPQGHSTSGSHERYKTPERLEWERSFDCIKKFREWILENALSSEEELNDIELKAKEYVRECRNNAWNTYQQPIRDQVSRVAELTRSLLSNAPEMVESIEPLINKLVAEKEPMRRDVMSTLDKIIGLAANHDSAFWLKDYYKELKDLNNSLYNTHLYNEGPKSPLNVAARPAQYEPDAPMLNGYEILNRYFDRLFASNPRVIAFGEDVGYIGDVNQGFAGLQAKHGEFRISDTGIRELTIMGQGIGTALRGLRPIAEIQYLDYLLYGLQPLSDDVATTHYRTFGKQSCPLIVRTRGHRLEGIWHSGSPLGMILGALRGMHICVPRNMVQAIGMYNTLLQGNDPALMIECLNGYRLKEKLPADLLQYTVPLGVPEIIRQGADITLVSYGSTLRVVEEAAEYLAGFGVQVEIIDVQTLLPFDIHQVILGSLKKTNRILFVDEDVPGGATAYMFNEVMEKQGGYRWLDVAPRTLSAKAHRPGYASDGDYFSKPNVEDIAALVKEMMAE
ncbi:thiamine pyrophosphate-dependent enzyme [Flavihumibacter stibioxidans]|uniref:3-methyl-2-oxobutanoate dehydrogenase (2-methylpropanoyl-transferring) n=1 Tax=Flavihumibacter stibioxidans TaxID=1834163 RepID=A0ABR7MCC9_9BACT|nr:alpha-ketoacid dehydrogenase subunit alpha/beta [Flavihumibacter stibioxidans]MBC6492479.1 transketolase [Flavihumibacter stibioxidans]